MTRKMKCTLAALLCMVVLLSAVFLIGRYGWKLFGFRACESTGIEQVTVEENRVHIRGYYPESFPQGFLGYYAEQVDDTLYVSFRFSGLFSIFEVGDFDATISTQSTVARVVVKNGEDEHMVWSKE